MAEMKMTRDFFLWSMSAIYLFAFASLFVQIPGLYGDNGILPAKLVLKKEASSFTELLTTQPTLLRLLPRLGLDVETGMDALCLGGVILAFVAMVSRPHRNCIVFGFLWVFYLSMFQVGQTFLWFQWDILLLEAGFLCILIAPVNLFGLGGRVWYHQHDHIAMWLVKWLLFRLMFASGVVKLTSGCPTWWGLTALNYHYETQCIPTPLSWYAHQLPEWWQKLSVVATYVIEIAVPFMFFSPVRLHRLFAFYAEVFLMLMIMLTGNYNFFNLLTCALCVSLVDDNFIRRWMGKSTFDVRDDAEKVPVIGRFWRPIKWVLNVVMFGGLIYWTVALFSVHFKTKPFRVESKVTFNGTDLDVFLQKCVPVTIWMGLLSLCWEILKSLARCILHEKGLMKKTYHLLGCSVFASLALSMFAISLHPHTTIDRELQKNLPDQLPDLVLRIQPLADLYKITHPYAMWRRFLSVQSNPSHKMAQVDHTVIEQQSNSNIWPVVKHWHGNAKRYELTSSYGLFRRMTGVGGRPEVIIEGCHSTNGGWREYSFLYKPGNVTDHMTFVAPHQPRLDWQMWFAALGSYQHNTWFLNLIYRLFHNQREVLELMSDNPFPDKPPKYIRATLYNYYFTKADPKDQLHSTSDWWSRKKVKEYLPIISKEEPSFVNYIKQAGLENNEKTKKSSPKQPNFFQNCFLVIRRLIGQADGFKVSISLFMTALVLTFLDPTLRLLQDNWPYSS